MQEQLSRNRVTKQSVIDSLVTRLLHWRHLTSSVTAFCIPAVVSARGTCTSLYITLAMT